MKEKPGITIRIASLFTKKIIVAIEDSQGESKFSLAYYDTFGKLVCPVFWLTKVGHCILQENGTVTGKSYYIKKWKFA